MPNLLAFLAALSLSAYPGFFTPVLWECSGEVNFSGSPVDCEAIRDGLQILPEQKLNIKGPSGSAHIYDCKGQSVHLGPGDSWSPKFETECVTTKADIEKSLLKTLASSFRNLVWGEEDTFYKMLGRPIANPALLLDSPARIPPSDWPPRVQWQGPDYIYLARLVDSRGRPLTPPLRVEGTSFQVADLHPRLRRSLTVEILGVEKDLAVIPDQVALPAEQLDRVAHPWLGGIWRTRLRKGRLPGPTIQARALEACQELSEIVCVSVLWSEGRVAEARARAREKKLDLPPQLVHRLSGFTEIVQ